MIKQLETMWTPTQEVTDLGGGKWKLTLGHTQNLRMSIEFEFGKAFDEKVRLVRSVTGLGSF